MKFITIFITIVIFLPIIVLLLYTIFNPRESALFGQRWKYNNDDLEPSDSVIKYNKIISIIALIVIIILLVLCIIRY